MLSLLNNGRSAQGVDTRFSERRKSLRWEVRVPVSVSGSYRSVGTISNLSTGGCAIHAMSSYQKGEDVLLVFALPGSDQVIIRATVHWASWPFLGVGFCAGQDQATLAVSAYLDNLTQRDLIRGIAVY
jgi:hypothetical protein